MMKEYFMIVISVIFMGGIVVSLAPEGTGQRYLRLLASLAVTGCIIIPLFSFLDGWQIDTNRISEMLAWGEESTQNYEEIYNNTILTEGARKASQELKNEIKQELALDSGGFDVTIITEDNGDEIYIARVELIIYPSGVAIDPHAIQKYVKERLGCECVVIYE
jgi:hypothetical protein